PLRVLVYNIHAGKDAKGADNLERVATIIRESGADVALLQEVDRGTERSGKVDQVETLRRLTGYFGAFGKTLDYQGGDYGIAILSRWAIVSDTLTRLPVEPPQHRSGVSYEPRGALRVVIAAPGRQLHVINTHIDPSREDFYRLQEARTLLTIASSLRDTGVTVVMGGDLNSEPSSAVIGLFAPAGWRDAFRECGKGTGLSYPANIPVKRIDYLMITGGTRCTMATVLNTEASDHRPVLFVLREGR
ncbi:MAG TPA: endonuclease/exonuclease/phosphatase family protein, partial [Gemmatimonadaceae bacterium]|nr:endonuclease/exonuclease/phosphatase family protein [Gemmatimonadaceae bacterium]